MRHHNSAADLVEDIYSEMSEVADALCRAVLQGDKHAARIVRDHIDGQGRLVLEYTEDWGELLARAEADEEDPGYDEEEVDRQIDERQMQRVGIYD